jgi:hypothetical protein
MMHVRRALVLSALLLSPLAIGCGGISYRYDTGSVRSIAGSESLHAVATEALDARAEGGAIAATGDANVDRVVENSLRDVRVAVADHLVRAGVVALDAPTLAAPTTPAEVEQALVSARAAGASEVVFVRFHRGSLAPACGSVAALGIYVGILPWLIIDSIPLWSHGGVGAFEVVIASSETGEVLGRSARAAAFSEHVSAWGCGADGVMHDMMRRSLELALEDVVAQARSGWPNRSGVPAAATVLAPVTRLEGNRVVSLGWSLEAPAGYTLEGYDPALIRSVRLSRSTEDHLDVTLIAQSDEERNFASHAFDSFRDSANLISEDEMTVSGHDARRGVVTVEGRRVHMLAVAAEGLGFLVACSGPDELCASGLASFAVTDELVADGSRH